MWVCIYGCSLAHGTGNLFVNCSQFPTITFLLASVQTTCSVADLYNATDTILLCQANFVWGKLPVCPLGHSSFMFTISLLYPYHMFLLLLVCVSQVQVHAFLCVYTHTCTHVCCYFQGLRRDYNGDYNRIWTSEERSVSGSVSSVNIHECCHTHAYTEHVHVWFLSVHNNIK